MYQFFDPSLMPVKTTDLDGKFLYVRTHGLFHYGYPDIISDQGEDDSEQLLIDILDRIFRMNFNINATWNYNGRIFRLEIGDDGLAHVVYPKTDETLIITILNSETGHPAKYITKGLLEIFKHPEAEVDGNTPHAKDILGYLMDQVKSGVVYGEDTKIIYEQFFYGIDLTIDRIGNPVVKINLEASISEQSNNIHKSRASKLMRIK